MNEALWRCDDSGGAADQVWFRAECEGSDYCIVATNDLALRPGSWRQVQAACNRWNSTHRGAGAYILRSSGSAMTVFSWFRTKLDLPQDNRLRRTVVEDFTDTAVASMREFFAWMQEQVDWSAVTIGEAA
jgi:hypothetical protein